MIEAAMLANQTEEAQANLEEPPGRCPVHDDALNIRVLPGYQRAALFPVRPIPTSFNLACFVKANSPDLNFKEDD